MKSYNQSRRSFIQICAKTGVLLSAATMAPSVFSTVIKEAKQWSKYDSAIVIDGLCIAFGANDTELSADKLATVKQSGISAINATIPYPGFDFERTNKAIDNTKFITNKYPSHFRIIKSASDILAAKASDQLGIILGFQSTEMFGDDLTRIKHFSDAGVRYMQLTYNNQSQFGGGGLTDSDNGVTPLGFKAIEEIQANNVLLDLSHSNKKTVAQATEHAKKPLTISHTGCNSLYQHPRNNDDSELRAVANKGGVVGIYLMPFLEGGTHEITAEAVMKHIDHAINICGEDHVSIGSDQGITPVNDGPEYREMIRKDVERRIKAGISAPGETPNRPPFVPELNSVRRMELIAWYMNKRGYSDSTIEKVLGKNLLNLYTEVWTST